MSRPVPCAAGRLWPRGGHVGGGLRPVLPAQRPGRLRAVWTLPGPCLARTTSHIWPPRCSGQGRPAEGHPSCLSPLKPHACGQHGPAWVSKTISTTWRASLHPLVSVDRLREPRSMKEAAVRQAPPARSPGVLDFRTTETLCRTLTVQHPYTKGCVPAGLPFLPHGNLACDAHACAPLPAPARRCLCLPQTPFHARNLEAVLAKVKAGQWAFHGRRWALVRRGRAAAAGAAALAAEGRLGGGGR